MSKHNTKTQPVKHRQLKLTSERNTNKTGQSEKRKYRLAAVTQCTSVCEPKITEQETSPPKRDRQTHTLRGSQRLTMSPQRGKGRRETGGLKRCFSTSGHACEGNTKNEIS